MLEKQYYIYRHIRTDKNEVFYIGMGSKGEDEMRYDRSREKYNRNPYWKNIVDKCEGKYGIEIMMEFDSESECLRKEVELIAFYGRKDNQKGTLTNLTDGGEGAKGAKLSDAQKVKLSERMKGEKHPNFGKKLTEETCKRKSDAIKGEKHFLFGKKLTEEWKENIRQTKYGSDNPMYKRTGELHPFAKQILNLENGILYYGIREAAEAHNINPKTLYQYIDGTRKNRTMLVGVN
jgi:hypothetical protein